MRGWLRRCRGAIGMGLTWAAGWMPIGALFGLALAVFNLNPAGGLFEWAWTLAKIFGTLGFFGGSIFSAVLRLAEGSRQFDELSLPRVATWGGVGGLLLGGFGLALNGGLNLMAFDVVVVSVTTLLGVASAVGTLALARRAEGEPLLTASSDIEEVGLTEQETKHLLGDGG